MCLFICYVMFVLVKIMKQNKALYEILTKITFFIFRYCFFMFRFIVLISQSEMIVSF